MGKSTRIKRTTQGQGCFAEIIVKLISTNELLDNNESITA